MDDDFAKQLELEELEKKKQENLDGAADPHTYTDQDGHAYEWNFEKHAWFPKVNDDFIAQYQSNYNYQGVEDEAKKEDEAATSSAAPKGEKRKANDPCWFEVDEDKNTNVYVSGLPLDTTEDEFIELMSKCGLVMKDPDTMKYRAKMYRETDGSLKGDGRCCYIKIESVKLALDILDGYLFKNSRIHVERAQFELKGQYDPSKKPRKKKAKDKEKIKKKIEKLFDWRPDKLRGMRSRNENTVVIKNMFDPKEFEEDPTLLLDYQNDVREECSKCGEVKRVVIYDRNPEGVVAVTFLDPEMADECINMMNGRWFAARQLIAETWDGKTKYKVIETTEEREKRLKSWDQFVTQEEVKKEAALGNSKIPDTNLNVPGRTYEMAGDTDSSGESDTESALAAKGTASTPPDRNGQSQASVSAKSE